MDDFEVFEVIMASCRYFHIGVDENKRIRSLDMRAMSTKQLPLDIWRLSALKDLSISNFLLGSPQVGPSLNLEELTIENDTYSTFPTPFLGGIEHMINLKKLNVSRVLLPDCVGNLKKLEILTTKYLDIEKLPDEIGNLTNLKNLNLCGHMISSLPTCIGNLKKLEEIYIRLRGVGGIPRSEFRLPRQLWQLYALRRIVIDGYAGTTISIPSSIEHLQNLQELYLRGNVTLPKEFGNLKRLIKLGIDLGFESSAASHWIPLESLRQLQLLEISKKFFISVVRHSNFRVLPNLEFLYVIHDSCHYVSDLLLDLVKASPSLCEVNTIFEPEGLSETACALACNRVSHRMRPFCRQYKETSLLLRKLWPQMLSNATNAFNRFPLVGFEDDAFGLYDSFSYLHDEYRCNRRPKKPVFEMHDAVYQMLVHGRVSFVQVLLSR